LIAAPPPPDNRTTALLAGSVAALQALGVWDLCGHEAAALTGIRLIDDTRRLLRAPEVLFGAAGIGLDAFGYNIENRHLSSALGPRAGGLGRLVRIDASATSIEIGSDRATIRLNEGRCICARLVVGADGRNSLTRAAAGIGTGRRSYPQSALTLNAGHARPH